VNMPLGGLRVVEVAGLGAAPFAGMMLSDAGADVVRVDRAYATRPEIHPDPRMDLLNRGRRSVAIDLKRAEGVKLLLRLADDADVLLEGFRPGVAERLGLGPDVCMGRNPRLVYGRVTGWGQEGPYAHAAGHDLNYIAVSGVLESIGTAGGPPVAPLNLLGDFGGGGMLLAYGVLCALIARQQTGVGRVVDAAMVEGSALLNVMLYGMIAAGDWPGPRGTNVLDSGAHFMTVYQCKDGKYIAVAAAEPKFYAALLAGLGLRAEELPDQLDRGRWPELKQRFSAIVATRTRDEWSAIFVGTDACVSPVLTPLEAAADPHNVARGTFVEVGGIMQPAPAPRFVPGERVIPTAPPLPGAHTRQVLADIGLCEAEIDSLIAGGVVEDQTAATAIPDRA
jgi:alpha-methylacyl-CoA racemase